MTTPEKMPRWVGIGEIILGLIAIITGVYDLVYPAVAVLTLILFLAIGLIFLGARDLMVGAMASMLPMWLRVANILLGLLALILSVIVIAEPGFAVLTLILILYVALFLRGVAGVAMGAAGKLFSMSVRGLSIAVGILNIILALIFLAVPSLAVATLVLLLSFGLIVTGLEAIAVGILGRKIVSTIVSAAKA